MISTIDGFWLPETLRSQVLTPGTTFVTASYADGKPCQPEDIGAVTARWPLLDKTQWQRLLDGLLENRSQAPGGEAFWTRLQRALQEVGKRFADPADSLVIRALATLPGYTGYSQAMVRFTLGALDLMAFDQFSKVFSQPAVMRTAREWQSMQGMPGWLRFYPSSLEQKAWTRIPGMGGRSLFGPLEIPEVVVGFGAGNVPGTALLIAMLAQATTLAGERLPAVVVKNSRQEPIFTPLVFSALEAVDPELLSTVAVFVWDYEDDDIQSLLLSQADLVLAAASDETIGQIQRQIDASSRQTGQRARFHAHGHKVSFAAISKETLAHELQDPHTGNDLIDVVCLLAALDSAYWDQYGCLSARLHFYEEGGEGYYTALQYAERLEVQLRMLASALPRGVSPRQPLMDQFDRFKLLEKTGEVKVLSRYEDPYVVAVDRRALSAQSFYTLVNGCLGRVVVVRPVKDLMEVPEHFLRMLPSANLQSLSLAAGSPGEVLPTRLLRFAEACGARGVTAIRSLGRSAFPQLAYSWDGLLPLDLVRSRPAGHFTTIEFDSPYEQMMETYNLFLKKAFANSSIHPFHGEKTECV